MFTMDATSGGTLPCAIGLLLFKRPAMAIAMNRNLIFFDVLPQSMLLKLNDIMQNVYYSLRLLKSKIKIYKVLLHLQKQMPLPTSKLKMNFLIIKKFDFVLCLFWPVVGVFSEDSLISQILF